MIENRNFIDALEAADFLNIIFVGRKSGRKFSTRVWFVKEGDKVYLLPVGSTSSNWYKDILKHPRMELLVTGRMGTAEARPITDKNRVDETVERFREKYGAAEVGKYYPNQEVAVELSI